MGRKRTGGRVLISGYYGHGNAGDEGILSVLVEQLRSARPDVELVVASSNPARVTAEHGLPAIQTADTPVLLEAARGADLLVVGGGGLFQDYWDVPEETLLTPKVQGLPYYLSLPAIGGLTGTPTAMYAVGVGPLLTERGRRLTRIAVNLCQLVTLRDQESIRLLRDVGVDPHRKLELVADPCFLLSPAGNDSVTAFLSEIGLCGARPLLGVCLRFWELHADPATWQAEVGRALDILVAETGCQIVFLPCQAEEGTSYENDVAVAQMVRSQMTQVSSAVVVDHSLDPDLLLGVIASCNLVLSMRFHTALFAIKSGVPLVALAYDPKVRNLMMEAGLADLALGLDEWRAHLIAAALRRASEAGGAADSSEFTGRMEKQAQRATTLLCTCLDQARRESVTEERLFLRNLVLDRVVGTVRLQGTLEAHIETERRLRVDVERLGSDARASVVRIEELGRDLSSAIAVGDALRRAYEDSLRSLDAVQEERHVWEGTTEAMRVRLKEARATLAALEEERNSAVNRSRGLAYELSTLKRALAVRAVFVFWRMLDRLLPTGSVRRRLYGKVRAQLARMRTAWGTGTSTNEPAAPLSATPSPRPETIERLRAEIAAMDKRVADCGIETVVVLLSGTGLIEVEGQRPTQLALELGRRGIPIIFAYFRWNRDEACEQDRLGDGVLKLPLDVLIEEPALLSSAFAGITRIGLFEFPYPPLFDVLQRLNSAGWITIYDVLDHWGEFHRLGQAIWYDEGFERHLITATDAVFAVNGPLADHVRDLGGEWVEMVPNGFRPGVDDVGEPQPLERGQITVGYFGYLSDAWFDWDLLAAAATRQPTWRFYVIGYGGGPNGVELPRNVTLLGRKPPHELAAYATNWDVGIVPFRPGPLAACADPIKTYEYLAMGLPVVLTGVPPPPMGEAFALQATAVEAFVEQIARGAQSPPEERARRRAFAAGSTWAHRVDQILNAVGERRQRIVEKRAILST